MSSNYFTIIIPTYNSENVLEIALKSIISQSYTEFEVLIIDGLSTDNTLEIARDFHDERIKIFSKKDNGIYDAMNKGIKLAQGEWLYFLGSDDTLFEPSTLQKIYEYIKNSNLEIIYGNVTSSRFKGLYGGEFDNRRIFYQNICHQAIFFKKPFLILSGDLI